MAVQIDAKFILRIYNNVMEAVIEARDLVKVYGEARAIDGVCLNIGKGECFGLVGPMGSGKSTLLKLMSCQQELSSGELFVLGLNAKTNFTIIRQQIAVVLESPQLDSDLSVMENLILYGRSYGLSAKKSQARALSVLRALHLDGFNNRTAGSLLADDQKRVALARALVSSPEILFLDEPTSKMNYDDRSHFWNVVKEIQAHGKSVVISTSNSHEANILCNRVLLMDRGRAIAQGPIEDLVGQNIGNEVVEIGVTAGDLSYYLSKVKGRYVYQVNQNKIHLYMKPKQSGREVMREFTTDDFMVRKANLEDVYLKLSGYSLSGGAISDRF